jgi:hyperosmotically inducible protein
MNKHPLPSPSLFTLGILAASCLTAMLGLTACQQEGPAEKAGQKIDRAAANAEQTIDRATDQAQTKITAAKESLDRKAEQTGAYVERSTDASKGALEKAGERLDQAAQKAEQKIDNAKESVVNKSETAGGYIDDSVITVTVKAALLNEGILKASHIEVTTVNGVVKLTGTVDSEPSLGKALEVASSQKNVKSVQTELLVHTPSGS